MLGVSRRCFIPQKGDSGGGMHSIRGRRVTEVVQDVVDCEYDVP